MHRRHAFLLPTFLAIAAPALAQTGPVEAEHQRGMALRARGQHDAAAVVFRALYERTREPRALARQGLAEAAAHRWVDADEHLRTALGFATDPWVDTNRAALSRDLALIEGHLGAIEVIAPTVGAELRVNGDLRGRLPLPAPLRLLAGPVHLELNADGYAPLVREFVVPEGVAHPTRIELIPQPRSALATIASTAPSSAQPPRASTAVALAPAEAPPRPGATQRILGVTGLVLGGLGIGAGAIGLVLRNSNANNFNDHGCRLAAMGDTIEQHPNPSCQDWYDGGNAMGAMSVVGFVAGGALAVTGLVLLFTAPSRSSERMALRCGLGPGDVGIACGGRL